MSRLTACAPRSLQSCQAPLPHPRHIYKHQSQTTLTITGSHHPTHNITNRHRISNTIPKKQKQGKSAACVSVTYRDRWASLCCTVRSTRRRAFVPVQSRRVAIKRDRAIDKPWGAPWTNGSHNTVHVTAAAMTARPHHPHLRSLIQHLVLGTLPVRAAESYALLYETHPSGRLPCLTFSASLSPSTPSPAPTPAL